MFAKNAKTVRTEENISMACLVRERGADGGQAAGATK